MITPDLAETMDGVARTLHRPLPLAELLQLIVQSCRDTVPGVEFAGISLVRRNGKTETAAATGEVVRALDAIQYSLGEGLCHDAIRGHGMRRVDDLAADARWPLYGPAAVEHGIRSQLGIELYNDEQTWVG